MPFTLTSQQYVKIHAVTQVLSPRQRHAVLVALAGKVSLNARLTQNRKVSDALLAKLIDDALREMRAATRIGNSGRVSVSDLARTAST